MEWLLSMNKAKILDSLYFFGILPIEDTNCQSLTVSCTVKKEIYFWKKQKTSVLKMILWDDILAKSIIKMSESEKRRSRYLNIISNHQVYWLNAPRTFTRFFKIWILDHNNITVVQPNFLFYQISSEQFHERCIAQSYYIIQIKDPLNAPTAVLVKKKTIDWD